MRGLEWPGHPAPGSALVDGFALTGMTNFQAGSMPLWRIVAAASGDVR